MNIEYKVKDLIKKYNTSNIKELVDHLDISIEYQDFKAKTLDSRLMIVDSKGYIFVRSDLDCAYENFLIVKEKGIPLKVWYSLNEKISEEVLCVQRKYASQKI